MMPLTQGTAPHLSPPAWALPRPEISWGRIIRWFPLSETGALTGGMAYEALNNAAQIKKNFIIVLNDNNMSISENVGGMSRYLGGLRTGSGYNSLKKSVTVALDAFPW